MNDRDSVIIIGSGIGGMTAGIVLAKLGYRVTVVEKNKLPGGLMRSYTRKGIECEVGIHYVGALDAGQPLRQIFDLLGVSSRLPCVRMGDDGIVDKYVLPDTTFHFPPGIGQFEENLHRAFPAEPRQVREIVSLLRSTLQQFSLKQLLFEKNQEFDLSLHLQPLEHYFDTLGCSHRLRGLLSIPLGWIGVGPDECPLYLWSSSLASYLMSSWKHESSGAAWADAFAGRFRELGGEIICDDRVTNILVQDKVVQGVLLKSGRQLNAPVVIAGIHPKLMLRMLPDHALKPSFRNRISSLEETHGIVGIHLAVPEQAVPYHSYNTFFVEDKQPPRSGVTFFNVRRTSKPGYNVISLIADGPYDKWRQWEQTTREHRPADYREAKERETAVLLDRAHRAFGPLPGANLVDAYTPLSFLAWMDSPEGGAYGVSRSVRQKFKTAALHRTPIGGLHAVGQSIFAPGILGTALGTLRVLAQIVGPSVLQKQFTDLKIEGI